MKNAFLYGLICFAAFPGAAHAQLIERACGHMPCNFEQFKAGEVDWFKHADANHDGLVDAQEQALVWQNNAHDLLPACKDMQNVKVLKLDRLPTDQQARKDFAAINTNADEVINAEEDRRITTSLNQTCQLLRNPQVQKLQEMLKKFKQGH